MKVCTQGPPKPSYATVVRDIRNLDILSGEEVSEAVTNKISAWGRLIKVCLMVSK